MFIRIFTQIGLFLVFPAWLFAQEQYIPEEGNLVNNPSFEMLNACPADYGAIDEASGWLGLGFTPDLFNACADDPKVGSPQNYFGTQEAAEGEGYAGILLYHENSPFELIGTNLVTPLEKGKKYEVSFKLSWAKAYSNYVCNNFCVLFTNNPQEALEGATPDIVVNDLLENSRTWLEVTRQIVADDAYNFIVLGNLLPKEEALTHKIQSTGYPGAYYYLDDISVKPVEEKDEALRFVKIKGRVLDSLTKRPLAARLDMLVSSPRYRAYEESKATDGAYTFSHLQRSKAFYLEVSAQGYFSKRYRLSLPDTSRSLEQDIYLQPSEVGSSVVIQDIRFEPGKDILDESSYPSLLQLATFLKENIDYKIELIGYTDSQGDELENFYLSERRAKAVVNYLAKEGHVSLKRMSHKGMGEADALASNDTEEGREINRRVEMKIVSE